MCFLERIPGLDGVFSPGSVLLGASVEEDDRFIRALPPPCWQIKQSSPPRLDSGLCIAERGIDVFLQRARGMTSM